MSYKLAYITINSLENAEKIAEKIIQKKLAACVNIIPKITSVYEWKGKIQKDKEVVMIAKTTKKQFESLQKEILALHPYEVPAILNISITGGHQPYLNWLTTQCGNNTP